MSTFSVREQQEKEALDDLSMELELADEDEPVLCVAQKLYVLYMLILFLLILVIKIPSRRGICTIAAFSRTKAP